MLYRCIILPCLQPESFKKLPTMARAVNTPARASRLVREESDDKVVCVINKHSFHKKIPFIHKRMEGTKSKKRRDAGASLSNQYMV